VADDAVGPALSPARCFIAGSVSFRLAQVGVAPAAAAIGTASGQAAKELYPAVYVALVLAALGVCLYASTAMVATGGARCRSADPCSGETDRCSGESVAAERRHG
jgi:hypothetical protein